MSERAAGMSPTACGGAYDEQAWKKWEGLDPGDHDCTCECTQGEAECQVRIEGWGHHQQGSVCQFGSGTGSATLKGDGDCQQIVAGAFLYWYAFEVGEAEYVKECATNQVDVIDPPSWDTTARACAPSESLSQRDCSANELCVPRPLAPFGDRYCIQQTGDLACPVGFGERHVLYDEEDPDDNRYCTTCTGCDRVGGACDGEVVFRELHSEDCSGSGTSMAGFEFDTECTEHIAQARGPITVTLDASPRCPEPNPGTPAGAIDIGTPTTMCCTTG